jgi:enamine deaminase RidA (YjgF/YER057c/UK114 family)
MGKIRVAEKAGEKIPGTWAVKADGSATTDPTEAIAGMLLPASGPKGFGLAFLIDLLCGVLSGGATGSAVQPLYGNASTPYDSSHLFIAIDITHFGDGAAMRAPRRLPRNNPCGSTRPMRAAVHPGEPEWVKRERAAGQVMLPSRSPKPCCGWQRNCGCLLTPLALKIRKDLKMAKREVKTDKIRTPSGVFSQATVIEAQGRLVFISGMTARRPDGTIAGIGDITAQTKQVCENIKSAVETAGGTLDDVCRVDVYVRNMEHFKEIHAVRQEYFKPPLPASTMVEICK